jgi:hypothetical protein
MKLLRFLLLVVALLVGLGALALALAFNSSFQTWAARKALAHQPGGEISLQRISAGLQRVQVEQLRVVLPEGELTLPALDVQLPVLDAALREKVAVSRLVAKGWTLDLTKAAGGAMRAPSGVESAAVAAAMVFQGIFQQLQLPVDLSLDGVELEGDIIFPDAATGGTGRARVTLQGGRLGAQTEGVFTFTVVAGLTAGDQPVNALNVRGTLQVGMDTTRAFSRLALKIDAEASGPALPQGVQLTADVAAARVPGGESYSLNVQSVGKRLVDLQANFPDNSARLGGVWKLDVRDTDIAPFVLGQPLPTFEAVGAGMFETDAGFSYFHAAGRLKTSADRLGTLQPQFAAVGAFGTYGEFDVTLRETTVRIDRLVWNLTQLEPVLTMQAIQAFEYNTATGELKVADATADLLVIDLQGVPLRWAAPFVQDYTFTGGALRGQLVLTAGVEGLAVRSRAPLSLGQLEVLQAGKTLLGKVDLTAQFAADYSPQGWQADLAEVTATSGGAQLLSLTAKIGQLNGGAAPIKAAGRWTAMLPALLQQPALKGSATLSAGRLQADFTASLGDQVELTSRLNLADLAVPTGEVLPAIQGDLRASRNGDGLLKFELPLVFSTPGKSRRSDLNLTGSLEPVGEDWKIDARLGAREVFLEDVQVLAALAGSTEPAPVPGGTAQSFWHGYSGQVVLALKKLHYGEMLELTDVGGIIRLEAGALRLDGLRAGMGEGADARVNGGLTFEPAAAEPYALTADLAVTDFNPAKLFQTLRPSQPAMVDGKFSITSRLTGRAANPAELADAAQGNFNLVSRGGVFRGLPVSVSSRVETSGRIATGVAAVGGLLGAVTGRKEYADIGSKALAVAELSKALAAIPYDQLNVVLARDESLATMLRDFTLIAPEMRLSGVGEAKTGGDGLFLNSALAMEFQLFARGRTADLLGYLGALENGADELGYTRSNLPLKVAGTLAAPDTGELNRALTNLALEKSGANDLLNRLLGGGK